MSLIKANAVQIGQSATATQNFTLSVPSSPDGTIKLARGNSGATTQDILTVDSAGVVTLSNGGTITRRTAQNSTSGTAIDFTGIPSWAKRITVMFNGVSTNGTSNYQVQLGTGGSPTTSGYTIYASTFGSAAMSSAAYTSGYVVRIARTTEVASGNFVFCNVTGNTWTGNYFISDNVNGETFIGGGNITLSGVLNLVRITTVNGTDTFDAGSINIMYEG